MIAFDAQSGILTIPGGSTTGAIDHTVSGSNTILWALVHNESSAGSPEITAITFNGVALTSAIGYTMANGQRLELFFLIAPASGTHSLSITRADGVNNLNAIAISYTGAKQSAQPDATAQNNLGAGATSLTCTLTTVADNTWSVMIGYSNGGTPTAGTNATRRLILVADRSSVFDNSGVAPTTPAGSFAMTFTAGAAFNTMAGIMASFAPYVAPPVVNSRMLSVL